MRYPNSRPLIPSDDLRLETPRGSPRCVQHSLCSLHSIHSFHHLWIASLWNSTSWLQFEIVPRTEGRRVARTYFHACCSWRSSVRYVNTRGATEFWEERSDVPNPQLQQRRQSSAGPPTINLPVLQTTQTRHSVTPTLIPLTRSQTAPVLSINIPTIEVTGKDGKVDKRPGEVDPDSPAPDICHSPSWSDHGKEKRKREKKKSELEQKERKEAESKVKKQDGRLKAAALKAGKRLSKKPPAAMETQRMPAALLRTQSTNSPAVSQSTSHDDSRRASTESRRSSASSITSIMGFAKPSSRRSVSFEPPSSIKSGSIVSTKAPQLGKLSGIEESSRNGSSSTQDSGLFSNGKLFGEEFSRPKTLDAYTGTQQQETTSKPLKEGRSGAPSQPGQQIDTPPPSRSAMEASGPGKSRQDTSVEAKPLRSIMTRRGSSENGMLERRDGTLKGYQYPNYDKRPGETTKNEALKTAEAFDVAKHRRIVERKSSELLTSPGPQSTILPTPPRSLSIDDVPTPPGRPSHDGGSYVHKQRMYQQQRSIAGYQDELAVEIAQAMAASHKPSLLPREQTFPPTPRDSAESMRKFQKKGSPGNRGSVEDDELVKDMSTWHHEYLLDGRVLVKKTATMQSINGAKIISLLGPSEDSGPGKVSLSSALGSHHPNTTTPTKSSPLLPLRQGTVPPPAGDSPHGSNERDNPSEIVKTEPSKNADSPKNEKRSSSKLDHSRTRTNSSQLLTSDLQPRTVVPPSPTTPKRQMVENQTPKVATHPNASDNLNTSKSNESNKSHNRKSEPMLSTSISHHTKDANATPEVIIGGIDGDGLIRQTSLKRPRSDPLLQVFTNSTKPPSLDFLPELKHQPLIKPKRTSPVRVSFAGPPPTEPISPPSPSQFPVPLSAIQSNKPPFSPSHPRRPSSNRPSSTGASTPDDPFLTANAMTPKPLAKMFVICCKCKYWHDLPSKLYEAMALPRKIEKGDRIAQSVGAVTGGEESRKIGKGVAGKGKDKGKEVVGSPKGKGEVGVEGKVFTTVKCPWCEHGMSTACCAGWTAVVYLHERHH